MARCGRWATRHLICNAAEPIVNRLQGCHPASQAQHFYLARRKSLSMPALAHRQTQSIDQPALHRQRLGSLHSGARKVERQVLVAPPLDLLASLLCRGVGPSGVGQDMKRAEPRFHAEGPRRDRECGMAQAVTVSALGINVQLRRNLRIL